jgi:hypothetical protein
MSVGGKLKLFPKFIKSPVRKLAGFFVSPLTLLEKPHFSL